MTRSVARALFLLALAWSGMAVAQQDADLALIPPDSQSLPKVSGKGSGQNVYLENALTAVSLRDDLPVAAQPSYDWQERLLLDVRDAWRVGRTTRLVLSDRLNFRDESDLSFPEQENVVNDLREAYIECGSRTRRTWRSGGSTSRAASPSATTRPTISRLGQSQSRSRPIPPSCGKTVSGRPCFDCSKSGAAGHSRWRSRLDCGNGARSTRTARCRASTRCSAVPTRTTAFC